MLKEFKKGDILIMFFIIVLALTSQNYFWKHDLTGIFRVIYIQVEDQRKSYKFLANDSDQIAIELEKGYGKNIYEKGRIKMLAMDLNMSKANMFYNGLDGKFKSSHCLFA